MKTIVISFLLVIAIATVASADMARVPYPLLNSGAIIQFFAPDNTLTQTTAVTSKGISLTGKVLYSIWSASGTCFERLMPLSTSIKASYTATPVPNTAWHTRAVNPVAPYLNISGCVGGYVKIH